MKRFSKCSECLLENSSRIVSRQGSAVRIENICSDCNNEFSDWTSHRSKGEGGSFDVNDRLVEFTLQHGGYAALEDLAMPLEIDVVSKNAYYKIAYDIEENGKRKVEESLRKTVEYLHSFLREDGDGAEIKDISVSCDGSWPKRGFTSKYGFVSVIHVDTGLVIDYEVLCKYCVYCEKHKSSEGDWYESHRENCDINYEGSSPAMETEGWKRLWSRSVEKCGFRYKFVISDGDSKAYDAAKNLECYGDNFEIFKEECSNHVAKRIGKAMRDLVSKTKGIGGKKPGSLTKDKIQKLQDYYQTALLQQDNEATRKALWATLEHSSSTNECHNHTFCPTGKESWCFYNKGIANGKDPRDLDHNDKKNRSMYVRKEIVKLLDTIYKRFSTDDFLDKCTGKTQNANECLHSVYWNKASKNLFYGRKRIEYLIALGVMQFNHGSQYSGPRELGKIGISKAKKKDEERKAAALKQKTKREERRKKYIRTRRKEQELIEKEGVTCEAGGF